MMYQRLSPLKENSPSRPKPPQPANEERYNSSSNSSGNNHHHQYQNQKGGGGTSNTNMATTKQQQQSSSSLSPVGGFSLAEIHDLHESFKLFDIHDTGSIQVGDLMAILQTLQSEQQQSTSSQAAAAAYYPHLDKLIRRLSTLGEDDTLTLDDYMNLMASTTISSAMMMMADDAESDYYHGDDETHNSKNNNYAHVFQLFDVDGKGYIELQDLERVALELGEHDMSHDELVEMIERATSSSSNSHNKSKNNDGRVGLEEFTRMMTMNLFPKK